MRMDGGREGQTETEKNNNDFFLFLDDPSLAPLGSLGQYVKRVTSLNFGENGVSHVLISLSYFSLLQPCPICMNNLNEDSGFDDDTTSVSAPSSASSPACDVCKLRKCGHMLHRLCLITYSKNSSDAKVRKRENEYMYMYMYTIKVSKIMLAKYMYTYMY